MLSSGSALHRLSQVNRRRSRALPLHRNSLLRRLSSEGDSRSGDEGGGFGFLSLDAGFFSSQNDSSASPIDVIQVNVHVDDVNLFLSSIRIYI